MLLIGDCGFCRTDAEQTEIGYTISPDFQRQGFGAETVRGLVNYLFAEFDVHRITASTDPDNMPSMALLEKVGFRKEGCFRKSIKIRGEWKDDLLYALLREEW